MHDLNSLLYVTTQENTPRGFLELEGCLIGPYIDPEVNHLEIAQALHPNSTPVNSSAASAAAQESHPNVSDLSISESNNMVFGFAVFHPMKRTFIFYASTDMERCLAAHMPACTHSTRAREYAHAHTRARQTRFHGKVLSLHATHALTNRLLFLPTDKYVEYTPY